MTCVFKTLLAPLALRSCLPKDTTVFATGRGVRVRDHDRLADSSGVYAYSRFVVSRRLSTPNSGINHDARGESQVLSSFREKPLFVHFGTRLYRRSFGKFACS